MVVDVGKTLVPTIVPANIKITVSATYIKYFQNILALYKQSVGILPFPYIPTNIPNPTKLIIPETGKPMFTY